MTVTRTARVMLILMTAFPAGTARAETADGPGGSIQVRDVAVERRVNALVVNVATTAAPTYDVLVLDSPARIAIDMSGTFAAPRSRWTTMGEPIREIRGSQFKPGTARLVIELTRKLDYRIEPGRTGLSVVLGAAPDAREPSAAKTTAPVVTPDASNGTTPDASRSSVVKPSPTAVVPDAPKPHVVTPAAAGETPDVANRSDAKMAGHALPPDALAPSVTKTAAPALPELPRMPQAQKSLDATPVTMPPRTDPAVVTQRAPIAQPATATADSSAPAVRTAQSQAPPPPAAPPPNGSKLITLEFKDADIVNLLRILAAESGRNIVAGDDIKGKVSVSLRNVTWEQALDTILEIKGLQKVERGGVIRIVSAEQLAKEREAQAKADDAKRKAEIDARTKLAEAELKEAEVAHKKREAELAAAEAQARGPLREEVIRLAYADPEDVAKTLQGILGIPPEGIQVAGTPGVVSNGPLLAEPPFSALYGLSLQQQQQHGAQSVSVSQDVLAKGLAIRANKATNSLFLRLYAADLDRIRKLIREFLDVPLPQVKIEARMEILDRTALEAIGVQWGGAGAGNVGRATLLGQGFQSPIQTNSDPILMAQQLKLGTGVSGVNPPNSNLLLNSLLPILPGSATPFSGNLVNLPISALPNSANVIPAGGIAFGIIGTNWNINLALQALATQGKTRTLARPEIVTVENNKAEISLGEELPYATVSSAGTQIQFKEALLKLSTTPTVVRTKADGKEDIKIKLVVVVENNSRGDVVQLGQSGTPPAINKRKADTLVLLNEGERLVIGGVTQSTNQNTVRKVPILGDIPVLGWLFKQKENFEQGREMVVFLTPSVLRVANLPMTLPPSR